MKIYFIYRNDSWSYDEYDSAVVIAESSEQAAQMLKDKHRFYLDESDDYSGWGKMDVTVTEIGTANSNEPAIVIESFNAG